MKLALRDITIDPAVQIRIGGLDPKLVDQYAEMPGSIFPPVDVFGTTNVLGDGFHRVEAAKRRGDKVIEAVRRHGGKREAEEWSVIANVRHGQKLSSIERDAGIERLLGHGWGWQRIGKELGIPRGTVGDIANAGRVTKVLATAGIPAVPTRSHLYQIADAPREHWPGLARVAVGRNWSVNETRAAVDRLRDPAVTPEEKAAILDGSSPPLVRTSEGDLAVLPETVGRVMADLRANDAEGAFYVVSKGISGLMAAFTAEQIVASMTPETRRRIEAELLDVDIPFLGQVAAAAGRGRKLEALP